MTEFFEPSAVVVQYGKTLFCRVGTLSAGQEVKAEYLGTEAGYSRLLDLKVVGSGETYMRSKRARQHGA